MPNFAFENLGKTLIFIIASIVCLLGFCFLLSWHFHFDSFLTLYPSTWAMPYLAAWGNFLSGLALFSLFYSGRFPYVRLLSVLLFSLGSTRLIDLLIPQDLNMEGSITQLLGRPAGTIPSIALLGAIGFSLQGLIFFIWSLKKKPWQMGLIFFMSLAVLALGLITLASYYLPLKVLFFQETIPIHFYTSICFIFIGIALLIYSAYMALLTKTELTKGLPFLIAAAVISCSFLAGLSAKTEMVLLERELLQAKSIELRNRIETTLQASVNALYFVVNHIESDPKENWRSDASLLMGTRQEFLSILRLSPDFSSSSEVNNKGELPLLPHLPSPSDKGILDAVKNKTPYLTLSLYGSEAKNTALLIFCPVYEQARFKEFVVGVLDIKTLLNKTFISETPSYYATDIELSQTLIIHLGKQKEAALETWSAQTPVHLGNFTLLMKVYPTSFFSDKTIANFVSVVFFIGGTAWALILAALVHLWQVARKGYLTIAQKQQELIHTQQDLQKTLNQAGVGTWSWDIKNNRVECDHYMLKIFGLSPENLVNTYEDFLALVLPQDVEFLQLAVQRTLRGESPVNYTFRILLPDGRISHLLSKGILFFDDAGTPWQMRGTCLDISILKQRYSYIQASELILQTLAEADSLSEALEKIYLILHQHLDWNILAFWNQDEKSKALRCIHFYQSPLSQFPEFKNATSNLEVKWGSLLIGRAWTTQRATWVSNIGQEPSFTRSKEAIEEGLKGALCIPIIEQGNITGIVELFKKDPFRGELEDGVSNLITTLSIGIGQFIHRKASEELLQELKAIFSEASEGIYTVSLPEGIVKRWNQAAEKIYGWQEEEILGQSITKIYPQEKLPEFASLVKRIMSGEIIEIFETERLCKDGTLLRVKNSMSPLRDNAGNVQAVCTLVQNLSPLQKDLLTLHKSENRFRNLVETTEEWLWEMDTALHFTYTNSSVQKILGYTPQEVLGQNRLFFVKDSERETIEKDMNNCIFRKKGWSQKTICQIHKNGSERYIESNAEPLFNDKKELVGFIGADRDVTEARNIEKAKDEFISMVSHELRTPLTSIQAAIGLILKKEQLAKEPQELMEIAYRNTNRLSSLISDILDVEKIQLGELQLTITSVVLAQAVSEALKVIKSLADQSQITLVQEEIPLDLLVQADFSRLMQVMINLLSNAIKFSPKGASVFVSVKSSDQDVSVFVRDQGEGIAEELQPYIFDKFVKGKEKKTAMLGTGLGLYICKSIITHMGGTISFTSKKGEGATFFFTLKR